METVIEKTAEELAQAKADELAKSKETKVTEDDLNKSLDTIADMAKGAGDELEKSITPETKEEKKEEVIKSFAEHAIEESDDVGEGFEVSDFLGDVVKSIGSYLEPVVSKQDGMLKALGKSLEIQGLQAVAIKGLLSKVEGLEKSLGELEKTPGVRKAALSGKPEERQLGKSEGDDKGGDELPTTELTKSQVSDALESFAIDSKHGVSASDLTRFLQDGQLKKSLIPHIEAMYK